MAKKTIDARLTLGVDPGRFGGFCLLLGATVVRLKPMPEGLKGIRIMVREMIDLWGAPNRTLIEDLSTHPKFSRTGIMASARHLGHLEGIFSALNAPYELIRPQEWQSLMYADPRIGCLEGKARSIKAAKLLCPDINLKPSTRARRDSDGLADAYLIARFGLSMPRKDLDDTGAA